MIKLAPRLCFIRCPWAVVIIILLLVLAMGIYLVNNRETPFNHAQNLIRAGKSAAALPILEHLSQQQPDNTALLPWLAQGYLSTEQLAEGRTALDTALRLRLPFKTLAPVVMSYAAYYEHKGDYAEAEKLFESAQLSCPTPVLAPGWAELLLSWAESSAQNGDFQSAILHLEKGQWLVNDLDAPLKSKLFQNLSKYYGQLAALEETQKHPDIAIDLLEKSLHYADEPATRITLANLYANTNHPDKAISNLEVVCQQDPDDLESRHKLIDLLLKENEIQQAQEVLQDLTDKELSLENFSLLAGLNLKLKNYAGAVHALEESNELKSDDPAILEKLQSILKVWYQELLSQGKTDEAASVKGHANRITEMLDTVLGEKKKEQEKLEAAREKAIGAPITLSSSHIWLSKGSLTPEGEITIKNISSRPLTNLELTIVFYDRTTKIRNSSVVLPVAGTASPPFAVDGTSKLYFSCPKTITPDHQLSVLIFWQGRFLKELPVVKTR